MTDAAPRRRRILNRLTVIRLVLQILLRSPAFLGARWWLQLALTAVDNLTTDLMQDASLQPPPPTTAARPERAVAEESRR